jgi:hypothetical protein
MSQIPLSDDDRDYLQERADRLRYLDQERAHAETREHPVVAQCCPYAAWLCVASVALSGLAIVLLTIVIGHKILLPDATVWPMGMAGGLCLIWAAGLGWFGVRGLK